MPVTFTEPVGGLLRPQQLLRLTLADCTQFRQMCGVGDRDGALSHIYINGLPRPADKSGYTLEEFQSYRPYAIISTHYPHGYRSRMVGSDAFDDSGSLHIEIQENVPAELADSIDVPMAEFEQRLGNILEMESFDPAYRGLTNLFQEGGYLAGNEVRIQYAERADNIHLPNFGDFLVASLVVHWGLN